MMKSWSRPLGGVLVAATVAALLVRVTIRDRYPVFDLLFYVTPWPVITGLSLVGGAWLTTRRPGRGLVLLALALVTVIPLGSAGPGAQEESLAPGCPASAGTLDVVFWNAARGGPSWDKVASELDASGADLIGLVEAGRRRRFDLKKRFPGYTVVEAGSGLAVLAQGDVTQTSFTRFGRLSSVAGLDVVVEERALRLFLVDIEAYPLSRRGPLIDRVLEVMEASAGAGHAPDRPVLVMGDFNTPHDSVWLEPLARILPPAFDGYEPTWPQPVPVLMLDHLFRSEALAVRCADVVSTRLSDHARLHVSLALP